MIKFILKLYSHNFYFLLSLQQIHKIQELVFFILFVSKMTNKILFPLGHISAGVVDY